jgi:hypothetical protein
VESEGLGSRDHDGVSTFVTVLLGLSDVESVVDGDKLTDRDFEIVLDGVNVAVGSRDSVALSVTLVLLVTEVVAVSDVVMVADSVAVKDPLTLHVADDETEVEGDMVPDIVAESVSGDDSDIDDIREAEVEVVREADEVMDNVAVGVRVDGSDIVEVTAILTDFEIVLDQVKLTVGSVRERVCVIKDVLVIKSYAVGVTPVTVNVWRNMLAE